MLCSVNSESRWGISGHCVVINSGAFCFAITPASSGPDLIIFEFIVIFNCKIRALAPAPEFGLSYPEFQL